MSYSNLVIGGGGIKAYSLIGVLQHMEETKKGENIKNILGVSAGSILGSLIALGCNSNKIKEIYDSIDFSQYKLKYYNPLTYCNILFKMGIHDPEKFKKDVISKILKLACDDEDISFSDVYHRFGKLLVISGTCLNKRQAHYYHKDSNPNMKLKDAITISCCVPYLFRPIKWKSDTLVDGGIIENYPLYFFNDVEHLPNSRLEIIKGQPLDCNKTIGITYIDGNTSFNKDYYSGNDQINNILDYTKSFLSTLLTIKEKQYIRDDYWEQTIPVMTENIESVADLQIPQETKELLIREGYKASKKYFS